VNRLLSLLAVSLAFLGSSVAQPGKPSYLVSISPNTTQSLHPGESISATVTVSPRFGYQQTVTLSCAVVNPTVAFPPTCQLQPNAVPNGSGTSTLTVTTSARTTAGTYTFAVDGTDANGQGPSNGRQELPVNILLNGGPITYTEVVFGTIAPNDTGWCTAGPSGSLGPTAFSGTAIRLTFRFDGNTANVVPYSVPRSSGFEIIEGKASFTLETFSPGFAKTTDTFDTADGIFVSVDNTNYGIGFGSKGKLPGDAGFPGQPVYPLALSAVTGANTYDLKGNFSTGSNGAYFANSCVDGVVGNCHAPIPLAMVSGNSLIINSGNFCAYPGQFTAVTPSYVLGGSSLSPSVLDQGTSAHGSIAVAPPPGYTADVTLSCMVTGATPSPTCSLQPNVVRFGVGLSTLTVSVPSGASNGTYVVSVTGTDIDGRAPANGPQLFPLTVSNAVIGETGGGSEISVITFGVLLPLWIVVHARKRRQQGTMQAATAFRAQWLNSSESWTNCEAVRRAVFVALFVLVVHQFEWVGLRVVSSEAILRLSKLVGMHVARISFDTVRINQTTFHFVVACAFIDVIVGSIPILWDLRTSIASNLIKGSLFGLMLFAFNIVRLETAQVVYALGAPWEVADGVVGGCAYFAVWLVLWQRRGWRKPEVLRVTDVAVAFKACEQLRARSIPASRSMPVVR
jgi:hypothetical protein